MRKFTLLPGQPSYIKSITDMRKIHNKIPKIKETQRYKEDVKVPTATT
jgi:hypothetical protein